MRSCPSLYMNVHLNMDCYFILRSTEIFSVFERKLKYIKGYLGAKCEEWCAEKRFEGGFFTLFQDPAMYEDHGLCPTSFVATKGESVLMCCPVKGFPPPQVIWEMPNGTQLETGSTLLHVRVNTENDFGYYRCTTKSLEEDDLTANIIIHKKSKYKLRI